MIVAAVASSLAGGAAVILEVAATSGARGLGEAAPLPGRSPDTVDDALAAAAALGRHAGARIDSLADAAALAAALTRAPAARFAIEAALVDALARDRGVAVAALLAAAPADTVPINAVVTTREAALAAVARGITTLKVKPPHPDAARDTVAAIRAAVGPAIALRLDLNRAWAAAEAPSRLAALADLDLAYVEEPCPDAVAVAAAGAAVPIALDETLADHRGPDAALVGPGIAALVIKPTLVGGLARAVALAALARAAGLAAVVTHALEGPIATAACAELARALGGTTAVGLDAHAGLTRWQRTRVPQLAPDRIVAAASPGLGLDRAAVHADLAELAP
jgi:o-succinylbenzoate synthase